LVSDVDVAALDAGVRLSVLGSGVRVATDPMAHTQSASIACFVGVGSRDEPGELAGASHFLEHLLFKGTLQRTAREINRAVDAVGGDFNAYTVRESTVFYVRVPATYIDFATDLLCEVIGRPRFDPGDVEIERNVILGELDGALDSPDDVVFMNLAEAMFLGHPLGR
jgi:predicted Zn-dependent peptidase